MRVIVAQVVIDRQPQTAREAVDQLAARLRQEMRFGRSSRPQVAVTVLVADISCPRASQV